LLKIINIWSNPRETRKTVIYQPLTLYAQIQIFLIIKHSLALSIKCPSSHPKNVGRPLDYITPQTAIPRSGRKHRLKSSINCSTIMGLISHSCRTIHFFLNIDPRNSYLTNTKSSTKWTNAMWTKYWIKLIEMGCTVYAYMDKRCE
jgi:hypothetical protein